MAPSWAAARDTSTYEPCVSPCGVTYAIKSARYRAVAMMMWPIPETFVATRRSSVDDKVEYFIP